jgi:DNA-binding SARP family transcriptional activator/tetratricopeptide (TPR) repeat protein
MALRLCLSDVTQAEGVGAAPLPLAPRDAALLAWLAIEGPTPRDRLAALLWPASGQAQGRTVLRQRLFQLKKALGGDLAAGSPLLALAEGVGHDLDEAVELLGTLGFADAPEFDAWLTRQRQQRQRREADSLRAQAQALEDAGDAAAALPVAQALLRHEPLSEVAHQRVMRLLYLGGDRAAALAAFDACEQLLKHELGARPAPETLALLATVERAQASPPAGARRALPAAVLRPPRMVGRTREAAALARAWAGAQVGAVIGEAGMGKTRLLAEFMDTQPGVVRAAGRPGDAGVPFATLARLLRAIEGRPAATLSEETCNQLARVLPELGGPGAVFPEGQRLQLQRAMLAYLQAAPGLQGLVLDDLHFADTASLEMLQALIIESRQPPWALAWRPAEAGSPVQALELALAEAAMLVPVVVAPLNETALAELVDELQLGIDGRAIAAQLLQRTGGNPLFVLETLKQAWVDRRIADLAQGGSLPKPMSVGQLMERRVAQLTPPALALARVASIAGVDFSLDLAEQVLGTSAMHLADALNALEAAQVLKGLQFAHDLVFDAVLASVPGSIAMHTHARTAAFLAQRQAEPARIAEHWLAACQPLSALPWLKAAAKAAGRAGRDKEQYEFLLRAADVEERFGSTDEAFELHARIFDLGLHQNIADPQAAAAAWERLARTDRQRARARIGQAYLRARNWQYAEGAGLARQALEYAQRTGEPELVNLARERVALYSAMMGQYEEAVRFYEQIAASIRETGAPAPESFHANHAVALDNLGRVREACRLWEEDLKGHDPQSQNQALSWSNFAINRQWAGRVVQAREHALESLRLHEKHETSSASRVGVTLTLARGEQTLGRWRQALQFLSDAEEGMRSDQTHWMTSLKVRRAECWADLGQVARALSALVEAAESSGPHFTFAISALSELARARRWAGQPVGDCLDRAQRLLPDGRQAHLRLRILLERCYTEDETVVVQHTDQVFSEAESLGLDGLALAALSLRALRLRTLAPALAVNAAERALTMSMTVDTLCFYKPELWWHAALALQAAGHTQGATACVQQAAAWVRDRVRQGDVPSEFIDSFLHRNPINRELLAWAGRLGPTSPETGA